MIGCDLGLSVRLLRYINSAYVGMAAKVSSVHDAAMKLGSRGVARWALTVTIIGAPNSSPELSVRTRLGQDDAPVARGFDLGPGALWSRYR